MRQLIKTNFFFITDMTVLCQFRGILKLNWQSYLKQASSNVIPNNHNKWMDD